MAASDLTPPGYKKSPPDHAAQNTMVSAEVAKWVSLSLLVVQNSSLFVVTRYSRLPRDDGSPLYISSVVVLVVELCKMAICLTLITLPSGVGGPRC